MTITLELPDELEKELSAEASRLHLPLSEYILRLLKVEQRLRSVPVNGSELVDYWKREDLIGTRQDDTDSAELARQLRRSAERRARQ